MSLNLHVYFRPVWVCDAYAKEELEVHMQTMTNLHHADMTQTPSLPENW
jgi:hypothetical protein